jgi:hypothetical protein
MAEPSEVLSLTTRTLGLWVRIPLEAWMCVRVFLCCAVLWVGRETLRRADPPSKESYQLPNRFISSRKLSSETGTGQEV